MSTTVDASLPRFPILDPEKLRCGKRISKIGSNGPVYEGTYDGNPVAIKAVVLIEAEEAKTLIAKRLAVSLLPLDGDDRSVVNVVGFCYKRLEMMLCVVMELCQSNLEQYLSQHRGALSANEQLRLGIEVATAVALHGSEIGDTNRGLRCCKILVDREGHAKLGDLGFGKKCDGTKGDDWLFEWQFPPELYRVTLLVEELQGIDQNRYSLPSVCIWGLGLVLWQISTQKLPLDGTTFNKYIELLDSGDRLPIPSDCAFAAVIAACWTQDPKARPSAQEVLEQLCQLLINSER